LNCGRIPQYLLWIIGEKIGLNWGRIPQYLLWIGHKTGLNCILGWKSCSTDFKRIP
jgi:hypothetical protein